MDTMAASVVPCACRLCACQCRVAKAKARRICWLCVSGRHGYSWADWLVEKHGMEKARRLAEGLAR